MVDIFFSSTILPEKNFVHCYFKQRKTCFCFLNEINKRKNNNLHLSIKFDLFSTAKKQQQQYRLQSNTNIKKKRLSY